MADHGSIDQAVSHTMNSHRLTCMLTFQVQSVSTHIKGLEARIQELEARNKKLEERHQKSVTKEDPYNEQQIRAKFRALQYAIEDLVKKHFSATEDNTGWASYDNIVELDERNFFLQSHIATKLADEYFKDDAPFFSYNADMDDKLAAFEDFLVDRRGKLSQKPSLQDVKHQSRLLSFLVVPASELVEWRIRTIKVADLASHKSNDHQMVVNVVGIPPDLRHDLRRLVRFPKGSPSYHALGALCASTFDLAFCLRSCRTEYEWKQLDPPTSITEEDIHCIEDYNVHPRDATGEAAKIVFGPLYKRVDNALVLLGKGTMLCS